MKKNLILFFAIIIASTSFVSESNAQFSAGLRLGFNASKYAGSRFMPGLHIGPYFRMAFKEKYRVQIDVLFSTKGGVYKGLYASGNKVYYAPFYIYIPLMFNYKSIAGLYLEAGVQPSIAFTELFFSAEDQQLKFIPFSDTGLRRISIAPIVGAGYEFKKVSLGLRAAIVGSSVFDYYNMTFMATFGFKF